MFFSYNSALKCFCLLSSGRLASLWQDIAGFLKCSDQIFYVVKLFLQHPQGFSCTTHFKLGIKLPALSLETFSVLEIFM